MNNEFVIKEKVKNNFVGISHILIFLVVYLSNLSYVTFGIVTLSSNSNVVNECQYIWVYNLIGIIYGATYIGKGAHTFTVSFQNSSSINDMTDINSCTYIDYVMIPILLIWGFYIQSSISGDCMNIYYDGHKELWDLCQGTFYGILSMTVTFVCLEIFMNYLNKIKSAKYSSVSMDISDPINDSPNIKLNLLNEEN